MNMAWARLVPLVSATALPFVIMVPNKAIISNQIPKLKLREDSSNRQ